MLWRNILFGHKCIGYLCVISMIALIRFLHFVLFHQGFYNDEISLWNIIIT